jgi:hypothetical protein
MSPFPALFDELFPQLESGHQKCALCQRRLRRVKETGTKRHAPYGAGRAHRDCINNGALAAAHTEQLCILVEQMRHDSRPPEPQLGFSGPSFWARDWALFLPWPHKEEQRNRMRPAREKLCGMINIPPPVDFGTPPPILPYHPPSDPSLPEGPASDAYDDVPQEEEEKKEEENETLGPPVLVSPPPLVSPPLPVELLRCWTGGQSVCCLLPRQPGSEAVAKCFFRLGERKQEWSVLFRLSKRLSRTAAASARLPLALQTLQAEERTALLRTLPVVLKQRAASRRPVPPPSVGSEPPAKRRRGASVPSASRSTRSTETMLADVILFPFYPRTLHDGFSDPRRLKRLPSTVRSLREPLQAEGAIERFALRCFRALNAHHAAGVLLGDIKPANIFVRAAECSSSSSSTEEGEPPEWLPVFGDYGYAMLPSAARPDGCYPLEPHETVGTPGYRAPEAEAAPTERMYCPASDVYSLASTLIDVIVGRFLQSGSARLNAIQGGLSDKWAIPLASPGLLTLLSGMLDTEAHRRGKLHDAIAACEALTTGKL